MGGQLAVHSKEGEGSTFHFTIPVEIGQSPPAAAPPAEADVRGLRVLVVDDNATNRAVLVGLLRQAHAVALGGRQWPRRARGARRGQPSRRTLRGGPARCLHAGTRRLRRGRAHRPAPRDVQRHGADADVGRSRRRRQPLPRTRRDALSRSNRSRRPSSWPRFDRQWPRHQRERQSRRQRPAATRGTTSLRVLVAEDNPVNQKLVAAMLKKEGHTVTIVDNGRAAVEAATDGAVQRDLDGRADAGDERVRCHGRDSRP